MKRLISVLLAVMLLLSSFVTVKAETSPYAKYFDSKEDMLSELEVYCESFPNVEDYDTGNLSEEKPGRHIERKQVIIPDITDGYSVDNCSYGEAVPGLGVNYTSVSFSGDDLVSFIVYYQMNETLIQDNMNKFGDENSEPTHKGTVNSFDYTAYEYVNIEGIVVCEYAFAVGDSLVVAYTDNEFSSDLVEKIEFQATDLYLPVYVENRYESQYASGKYADQFAQYLIDCGTGPSYEGQQNWYMYSELYEYYSENNNSSTPDWVLVSGCTMGVAPSFCYGVFDKYYIQKSSCYTPDDLGYFIYLPSKNNFYSLSFAWIEKFENIELAFSECLVPKGIAQLLEDYDGDGAITKADAENEAVAQGLKAFSSYDERMNLYVDTKNSGWNDIKTIYYCVMDADGKYVHLPNMEPSDCSDFDSDGMYRCDMTHLSFIFDKADEYQLYFSNDKGDETAKLAFKAENVGDTVYFTGEYDSDQKPVIKWTNESDTIVESLTALKDALAQYEAETGEKVDTNRYYFLMPNGDNGVYHIDAEIMIPDFDYDKIADSGLGYYAPSWVNDYTDTAGIWWLTGHAFRPDSWPGYAMEKTEYSDIFYADVPKDVESLMFNNTVDAGMDSGSPLKEFESYTDDVIACGYEPGENELYPEGVESFDNMIFVLDPSYESFETSEKAEKACNGNWYYYYGEGCYGERKDGRKRADCIRDDHVHKQRRNTYIVAGDKALCGVDWDANASYNRFYNFDDDTKTYSMIYTDIEKGTHEFAIYTDGEELVKSSVDVKYDNASVRIIYDPFENVVKTEMVPILHFDAKSTGWSGYTRVYCHIYEYGGDSFYAWQSNNEICTDRNNDGIWTYDLEAKKIKLDEDKTYVVIFSNENFYETPPMVFDTSVVGDTVYCDGEKFYPENLNSKTYAAYWKNQDSHNYGAQLHITILGDAVGSYIAPDETAYDLFKSFLKNYLTHAQKNSGKTDQALLDDLAEDLDLTANEVEFALKELSIDDTQCTWKKAGSTLEKSNNTSSRKKDIHQVVRDYKKDSGDRFETNRYYFLMPSDEPEWTWYNEHADSAYIHWNNTDRLDLEGMGAMAMNGDTPDVYYADVPDFVTTLVWNNGVDINNDEEFVYRYARRTMNIQCEYYDPDECELYPDGLESFDNMIFVLDRDAKNWGAPGEPANEQGEWYYYYGNECYGTQENGNKTDCLNPSHDHTKQKSVKEALAEYEAETGEKVQTNRYYFLMPDGTNGVQCDSTDCIESGHYAQSWHNEYTDQPAVFWWETGVADPKKMPGYTVEKGDSDGVFYADVPKAVIQMIWNNNIEASDINDPMLDYQMRTVNIGTQFYDPGESDNYPDGTTSFDNMIYVIYPDTVNTGEQIIGNRPVGGEWYYYYGDGCYGTVKDGKTADCIRDDHDHLDRFLHFDATTTNWKYYEKVYCHIWEYGGDPFYLWQQKSELCTDNDGDGIWTYDLEEKGIELEDGKLYAVIFSNENQCQTYNLLFDKTVLGDTAYCDGTIYESPEAIRSPEFAYWRNQNKAEFGPELMITSIGEIQGTCVPKGKTEYDLFKEFLTNDLVNAQTYSGKTDQALLDDLAKGLKLSSDDVERALKETGVKNVDWKHPDKLSVKEALSRYETETGEKVKTIRYYFLMPNGKNGQFRTDDVDGNPFASSWYNTYADKPGVYWWDVNSYDPPRLPGYYLEKSDSQDVYYADLPIEVEKVIWNNYIFTSMDTIVDPMYAYSCNTKETILPHHIYSSMPGQEPAFIYVVNPDTEITSEISGNKTIDGKWYYYYGNGCYGETPDEKCIRDDHDHRVYDTYIVAGVEALCGSSWDLYDENNKMTYNAKTGAYEIIYTDVAVGTHEFMVTKNHEFGPITPGNPDYNEAKVTVEGSSVKITYTVENGVQVKVTPPLLGDVDLDGVVSIMDATEIQLAISKHKTLTAAQEKLADTDKDGEISILDATAIQLLVAKKITEF